MSTVNVNVDVGVCKFSIYNSHTASRILQNVLWSYVNCILMHQWVWKLVYHFNFTGSFGVQLSFVQRFMR